MTAAWSYTCVVVGYTNRLSVVATASHLLISTAVAMFQEIKVGNKITRYRYLVFMITGLCNNLLEWRVILGPQTSLSSLDAPNVHSSIDFEDHVLYPHPFQIVPLLSLVLYSPCSPSLPPYIFLYPSLSSPFPLPLTSRNNELSRQKRICVVLY